jgi:hypothetical protein
MAYPGEPGPDRSGNRRIEPKLASAGLLSIPDRDDLLCIGGGLALSFGTLGRGRSFSDGALTFLRTAVRSHKRRRLSDQVSIGNDEQRPRLAFRAPDEVSQLLTKLLVNHYRGFERRLVQTGNSQIEF